MTEFDGRVVDLELTSDIFAASLGTTTPFVIGMSGTTLNGQQATVTAELTLYDVKRIAALLGNLIYVENLKAEGKL